MLILRKNKLEHQEKDNNNYTINERVKQRTSNKVVLLRKNQKDLIRFQRNLKTMVLLIQIINLWNKKSMLQSKKLSFIFKRIE